MKIMSPNVFKSITHSFAAYQIEHSKINFMHIFVHPCIILYLFEIVIASSSKIWLFLPSCNRHFDVSVSGLYTVSPLTTRTALSNTHWPLELLCIVQCAWMRKCATVHEWAPWYFQVCGHMQTHKRSEIFRPPKALVRLLCLGFNVKTPICVKTKLRNKNYMRREMYRGTQLCDPSWESCVHNGHAYGNKICVARLFFYISGVCVAK